MYHQIIWFIEIHMIIFSLTKNYGPKDILEARKYQKIDIGLMILSSSLILFEASF